VAAASQQQAATAAQQQATAEQQAAAVIPTSAQESLDPCIAPLVQDSLLQGRKICAIDQVLCQ